MEGRHRAVAHLLGECGEGHDERVLRVRDLVEAIIGGGSDEEWVMLAETDGYALLRRLAQFAGSESDVQLSCATGKALLLLSGIVPRIWQYVCGDRAAVQTFVGGATATLSALQSAGDVHAEDRQVWLTLLTLALPESPPLRELMREQHDMLEELLRVIMWPFQGDGVRLSSEEEGTAAASLITCLNFVLEPGAGALIALPCSRRDDGMHLGVLVLHALNDSAYPCHSVETRWQIKYLVDVLSDAGGSACFPTNDLRVLIDILTRELHNCPPDLDLVADYLALTQVVLVQARWDRVYRREELQHALAFLATNGSHPKTDDAALCVQLIASDILRDLDSLSIRTHATDVY